MNGTGLEYDIAIVGAGAFGTSVLGQISLHRIPKGQSTLNILVVESSQDLGPGMPYSKHKTIPDHIVNIAGGCTQITATYIPVPERSDFLVWLCSLPAEYRESLGIEGSDSPSWMTKPFPRFVVGLYLSNRFNQFVMALREKGFKVDVRNLTTVTSVSPTYGLNGYGYEVELDRKSRAFAKNLFIATGHWTYNRFPDFPHWLPSPFPPQEIKDRTKLGCNVGILGCSLSAIDTVLTLSEKNGTFQSLHQNGKHRLKFVPFNGAEAFKMTMYGRKAMLPQVMGVVVNKIFSHKYLTPEFFFPIIEANDGFLPLDEFWYLLKREIYDEVPHLRPYLPDRWETMPLEEAVDKMRRLLQATDPIERLSKELDEANESLKAGIPLLLQNVFYQSYSVFDEAFSYFSAEDRIRFQKIKTDLHLLIGPFPVQNAEKILALMTGSYLEVTKIGEDYEIKEANDRKGIKLSWRQNGDFTCEAHLDVMIDATGQKSAFEKDKTPLTTSLRKAKLLKEILVPFRNIKESQNYEDHPNVVKRNGVNYFRPSGALININNFSLVPATEAPVAPIYYMGPLTMGQIAFPQDMSVVTTAGERTVADLVKRGVLERENFQEEEQDPFRNANVWLVGEYQGRISRAARKTGLVNKE